MKTTIISFLTFSLCFTLFSQPLTPVGTFNGAEASEHLGAFVDHGFPYKFAVGSPGASKNGEVVGKIQLFDYLNFELRPYGSPVYGNTSDVGFGEVFDLEGNQMVVGMPEYENGRGLVRVYEWKEDIEEWEQKGTDIFGPHDGAQLGMSVAMKVKGDTIVVGAPFTSLDGANQGEVRVYKWNGSDWELMGRPIKGLDPNDLTGYHVKVSRTKPLVVIGEPGNNVGPNLNGRIRFFEWNGNDWQQAFNVLEGPESLTGFGIKFDLTYHNDRFVVGMPIAESTKGVVKSYILDGNNWVPHYSDLVGEEPGDLFGSDLNIVIHGQILIIGAPQGGNKPGFVNVYHDYGGNQKWDYTTTFEGLEPGERFGAELAISELVETILVGSPNADSTFNDAGKISLFPYVLVNTNEINPIEELEIYPNPVGDILTSNQNLQGKFKIVNLQGETLSKGQWSQNTLEVGAFPAGVYFLIIDDGKKTWLGKFIKK